MSEWKVVPAYPMLEASSTGLVRDRVSKRLRRQYNSNGYRRIYISIGGARRDIRVHHLVAWAFHGPGKAGEIVRHLNDQKADNRAENLRWGTQAKNHADARRNGTASCDRAGPTHPRRRAISVFTRLQIIAKYRDGAKIADIANELGYAYRTIWKIVRDATMRKAESTPSRFWS